jgi:uncharacterized membrane protein YfcA
MLELGMFAFGLCVGAVGTMLGVGGGLIIVPVIALLFPSWAPCWARRSAHAFRVTCR